MSIRTTRQKGFGQHSLVRETAVKDTSRYRCFCIDYARVKTHRDAFADAVIGMHFCARNDVRRTPQAMGGA